MIWDASFAIARKYPYPAEIMTTVKVNLSTLYDRDYLEWINLTLDQLRNQDYSSVDWPNLIEEIEDIAKEERLWKAI